LFAGLAFVWAGLFALALGWAGLLAALFTLLAFGRFCTLPLAAAFGF
jgi:hypothetical protein